MNSSMPYAVSIRTGVAVAVLAAATLTAGCAYPDRYYVADNYPARAERIEYYYPARAERIEYGVVDRIELQRDGSNGPIGLGTIVGGVAGGVIGHQFGSGSGNTAATIAGAIGGALVGNQIEKSHGQDRYRIIVRLDSGAMVSLADVGEGELRRGDRVRIVNNRAFRA